MIRWCRSERTFTGSGAAGSILAAPLPTTETLHALANPYHSLLRIFVGPILARTEGLNDGCHAAKRSIDETVNTIYRASPTHLRLPPILRISGKGSLVAFSPNEQLQFPSPKSLFT